MLGVYFSTPGGRHRAQLLLVPLSIAITGVVLLWPPWNKALGIMQNQAGGYAQVATQTSLWPISIDYPEDGSIFPPGITAPTILWRDGLATSWSIDISFADHATPIHILSKGERMRIGPLDPDCVSSTNEPPQLTPQQAASWAWTPDAATWQAIQIHSTASPATLAITGFRDARTASEARIAFTTSSDPVGAPIFYRDVPLMPSKGANGTVQPLSPAAPSYPLATPGHSAAREPNAPDQHAHLRQLPLVFRRWKDHGH